MVRRALKLGLVVTFVDLALSSCGALGAEQEQANESRPLPEYPQDLRAGEYHSKVFKPSVPFSVGKGWALSVPWGPISYASRECLDLFALSDGDRWSVAEGHKNRFTVLEDVEGEKVSIVYGSSAAGFDELMPEAENVLESVEWRGT
jgi:hypothetical protein